MSPASAPATSRSCQLSLEQKHYEPSQVEDGVHELWEQHEVGRAGKPADRDKPKYSIVIPPPNVTGRLHMGHALNNTIQDLLIRYKRMDGFDALWIPGTDHAGIATQNVVKRQLEAKGQSISDFSREDFIEKVWAWKEEYGNRIINQLKSLGCSCDWSRTAFTMDDNLSNAVATIFKRFYDEGLIYRGKYIVNWCPKDKTALSDNEVETKDGGEPGHLWYLKYPLTDGSGEVIVATTRPETMLGDTAVAVNPEDERFAALIGKTVTLPLVGREIPIVADEYVDASFGTGCVKITPAHDPNDFQLGQRHNLPQINIMNEDASMNDEVPEAFRGLGRFQCRKAVVAAMDEAGLLEKIEDRMTPVGRSYRSGEIIEYRLSDQWFVKVRPLADRALEASKDGGLKFFPERWNTYYTNWLENLRDWCISRQLWWGHRIPAWYHIETGEMLVDSSTPVQVEAEPDKWRQDEDVLDTWFSSALWPFSTLGWPEQTEDLKRYFPTDVLVTAKDIISFWVSRMVMSGLYTQDQLPFPHVLINSVVCDEKGETMSKSKGNGIDPFHVINGATVQELEAPVHEALPVNKEKVLKRIHKNFPDGFSGVGADAMRYTLLTNSTDAQQLQISLSRFEEIGKPLTNKMWNATKLVVSILEQQVEAEELAESQLEDYWILSRAAATIAEVRKGFDDYAFHYSAERLYHFFWDDICDWYLEIVKPRLRDGSAAEVRRVQATLASAFSVFLRLMHPLMPFITEELWGHFQPRVLKAGLSQEVSGVGSELLARAEFPEIVEGLQQPEIEEQFSRVQEVVKTVRTMRANASVSPSAALEAVLVVEDSALQAIYESASELVSRLANLEQLRFEATAPPKMAVTVLSGTQVCLNLIAHMDLDAEIARNEKAKEKLAKQLASLSGRLANEKFVANAPEQVVAAEREKLKGLQSQIAKIDEVIAEFQNAK